MNYSRAMGDELIARIETEEYIYEEWDIDADPRSALSRLLQGEQ